MLKFLPYIRNIAKNRSLSVLVATLQIKYLDYSRNFVKWKKSGTDAFGGQFN